MQRLWPLLVHFIVRGTIHDLSRVVRNGWLIGRAVSQKEADDEVGRGVCKVGDDSPRRKQTAYTLLQAGTSDESTREAPLVVARIVG